MGKAISVVVAGIAILALTGCGDDPMPTQPPMPLDVSGTWHGSASTSNVRSGCGNPEPVAVTATFTQNGVQVTGTFSGGCLDGATFEGQVQGDQRLLGQTTFVGHFECPGAGATGGPGSATRLALNVAIVQNPITGTCTGPFGTAHGTLTVELSR
jgi:hypothetical protein